MEFGFALPFQRLRLILIIEHTCRAGDEFRVGKLGPFCRASMQKQVFLCAFRQDPPVRGLPDDPIDHSIVNTEEVRGSRDGPERIFTVDLAEVRGHFGDIVHHSPVDLEVR